MSMHSAKALLGTFIRFPAKATKEKAEKTIPINHHVKAVLETTPRAINHDFVFTYEGKPISSKKTGVTEAMKTACKKAKIPCGQRVENGITMHDFRRTFKTNMLKAGIDKVYRDTIVGHSLRGMDVHYIIADDDDLKAAIDKFTNWVDFQLKTTRRGECKKIQNHK
jgi:integrase